VFIYTFSSAVPLFSPPRPRQVICGSRLSQVHRVVSGPPPAAFLLPCFCDQNGFPSLFLLVAFDTIAGCTVPASKPTLKPWFHSVRD
jgi:hypothetical protein